jgi:ribosomal protein S5
MIQGKEEKLLEKIIERGMVQQQKNKKEGRQMSFSASIHFLKKIIILPFNSLS